VVNLKFNTGKRGRGHVLARSAQPRDYFLKSWVVPNQQNAVAGIGQPPDQFHQVGSHGPVNHFVKLRTDINARRSYDRLDRLPGPSRWRADYEIRERPPLAERFPNARSISPAAIRERPIEVPQ
jgi:hypothetical protein